MYSINRLTKYYKASELKDAEFFHDISVIIGLGIDTQ